MASDIVISLGGSIIVPDEIDVKFLKAFKELVLKHSKSRRFIIVCGGGRTCRKYNDAAKAVSVITDYDLDMVGIMATRLNAELVRAIFGKKAYSKAIYAARSLSKIRERVVVVGGNRPGNSTDLGAARFAKTTGAKLVINLSNIDYVYDKDPKLGNAKPIKKLSWKEYRAIFGELRKPGMHIPFDPVAARLAQKNRIKVIVAGNDLKNLDRMISGRSFRGTVIQ